eukprot:Skav221667  [mRNA]  locus=scaffold1750:310358:317979:+ [translate_table: standard]
MYIGPAAFAGGETVVGVKLDEKRSTSDCDGMYKNERFFRCQPGYGIYQVPPELADEDVRMLPMSEAPDVDTFDLEEELNQLIGLKDVKDSIRHTRNFIEVQKRRSSVTGDASARALHFAFMQGTAGSEFLLQAMCFRLLRLPQSGRRGHAMLEEAVSRQTDRAALKRLDGIVGNPGTGKTTVARVVADLLKAYALVGDEGHDSFGREALDTLIKLVEDMPLRVKKDSCAARHINRKAALLRIEANPGLRSRFPTVIDFDDYTCEELLEIADGMLLQEIC